MATTKVAGMNQIYWDWFCDEADPQRKRVRVVLLLSQNGFKRTDLRQIFCDGQRSTVRWFPAENAKIPASLTEEYLSHFAKPHS